MHCGLFGGSVGGAILIVISLAALASSAARPFISSISPEATIVNYEVFTPSVNYADPETGSLTISVEAESYSFEIVLEMNTNLLSPDFSSSSYNSQGEEVTVKGHPNCFYHGKVTGHSTWTAAMSTCNGLRGSFGNISKKKQLFYIEPLGPDTNLLEQPHAIYVATEHVDKVGTCGVPHGEGLKSAAHEAISHHNRLYGQAENGFLVVELAVVNDMAQINRFGGNVQTAVTRALEISNNADSLYKPLGIRVVLTRVISWNTGNQISVVTNPTTLLNNFLAFSPQITSTRDVAMLFTGVDMDGTTVGIAFVGTMCGTSSVGVVQDFGSLAAVGSTTAHEMGHIFSMQHDTGTCTCNDANGCIMGAVQGFIPPTKWSNCSLQFLSNGLNNANLGVCLTNDPAATVGAPVCGNGILEGNEICDCGTPKECKNPCCNATTCKLATGAQCTSGVCCASCKFKTYGTVCRPSVGECDINEFCSGASAVCPADLVKINGSPCAGGIGSCFNGLCPTRDSQCKFFYGSSSGDGAAGCYTTFNPRGDLHGNCGSTAVANTYRPCATGNVMCGSLQCLTTGSQFPMNINLAGSIQIGTHSISATQICKSFLFIPSTGVSTNDIWLPKNGTKCGTNQICLAGQCTPLSSLPACPTGTNGIVCSGNGLCSNGGTCACNVGFTGSTCSLPFAGPVG
eukprot:Em0012g550a